MNSGYTWYPLQGHSLRHNVYRGTPPLLSRNCLHSNMIGGLWTYSNVAKVQIYTIHTHTHMHVHMHPHTTHKHYALHLTFSHIVCVCVCVCVCVRVCVCMLAYTYTKILIPFPSNQSKLSAPEQAYRWHQVWWKGSCANMALIRVHTRIHTHNRTYTQSCTEREREREREREWESEWVRERGKSCYLLSWCPLS